MHGRKINWKGRKRCSSLFCSVNQEGRELGKFGLLWAAVANFEIFFHFYSYLRVSKITLKCMNISSN